MPCTFFLCFGAHRVTASDGRRQLSGIQYTEAINKPNLTHLAQRIMRIIDELLESKQIDKTKHGFLAQTNKKQNEWGKMYLLLKVHKLIAEKINLAEMH